MNDIKYDPKLKEAMAEINAILKKHDIAGHITLASETHSEFAYHITPSWSCAKWEGESTIRFKSKKDEIGKEASRLLTEKTCHMIYSTRDLLAMGFMHYADMAKAIETQVKVEHSAGEITPHREN